MKPLKPRNYVALALMKRNGFGAHDKTAKAKRLEAKRQLIKELKKPSGNKTEGFFYYLSYSNFIQTSSTLLVYQIGM